MSWEQISAQIGQAGGLLVLLVLAAILAAVYIYILVRGDSRHR